VNANAVGIDQALAELLDSFDAFCQRARRRLIAGHTRYGQAWRTRDNLAALCEEAEDSFVYGFFDWLSSCYVAKLLRRVAGEGGARAPAVWAATSFAGVHSPASNSCFVAKRLATSQSSKGRRSLVACRFCHLCASVGRANPWAGALFASAAPSRSEHEFALTQGGTWYTIPTQVEQFWCVTRRGVSAQDSRKPGLW